MARRNQYINNLGARGSVVDYVTLLLSQEAVASIPDAVNGIFN
jgi:hypothetical protein